MELCSFRLLFLFSSANRREKIRNREKKVEKKEKRGRIDGVTKRKWQIESEGSARFLVISQSNGSEKKYRRIRRTITKSNGICFSKKVFSWGEHINIQFIHISSPPMSPWRQKKETNWKDVIYFYESGEQEMRNEGEQRLIENIEKIIEYSFN